MTIRFANTQDIPKLLELLHQVEGVHHQIRPDLFRDGGEKYTPEQLHKLLADPCRPVFAALEEGNVVGYCFCILQEVSADPVLLDTRELYIDDLCVDVSFRGQGVAGALWQHVCAYARSIGCRTITLNVWQGNDRARKFYEKQGMTVRKTVMEFPL